MPLDVFQYPAAAYIRVSPFPVPQNLRNGVFVARSGVYVAASTEFENAESRLANIGGTGTVEERTGK